MTKPSAHHLRLPPEQFYWALLEVPSAFGWRQPPQQQLEYLFESLVPRPIEQVHAIFLRLEDGRYLACALEKEVLAECLHSQPAEVHLLTPSSLPACIDTDADPDRLNVLVRQFELDRVRKLRRNILLHAAAFLLACSALLGLGMELRTRQLEHQTSQIRHKQAEMFTSVLGAESLQSRQPPELQLQAQLRQLRQTRSSSTPQLESVDAADSLTALLNNWPDTAQTHEDHRALYIRTELISITPSVMTIRSLLPDSSDAQRLVENFQTLGNWRIREPQLVTTGDAVRATLQFFPEVASSETAP